MANGSFLQDANAKPATTLASDGSQNKLISDTTTASFKADVLDRSKTTPILVDFWAPWCEPCKQLTPILEKAVSDAKGAVLLKKMNIDEHPAIAGQLGIQSIPAVIAFVDGRPVDGLMGAQAESEIKKLIAKITGNGEEAALEEAIKNADQCFQNGDLLQATEIYSHILTLKPENQAALSGLANCFLASGDIDKAELILNKAKSKNDPAILALSAKIALIKETKKIGDPLALKKRAEANPKDYQARFDLALIYNAQGEKEKAADELLAIMQLDRNWGDDKARKQLVQFFDAWGQSDTATLAARRKLSAHLFS